MLRNTDCLLRALLGALMLFASMTTLAQSSFDERVQTMYVAYYGRPGDPGGVEFWSQRLAATGGELSAIIDAFGSSAEYNERFSALDNSGLVNNIYVQLLGRDADPEGSAFYVGQLESGAMTLASIALNIADGVQPDGTDAAIVAHRLQVANAYTEAVHAEQFEYNDSRIETARALLAAIDGSNSALVVGLEQVANTRSLAPSEPGMLGDGRLVEVLENVRAEYGLPAMGIILVRQGQVAELATSGVRVQGSVELVTNEDLWHLGSITKAMTATLVGALVERGAITWESTPAQIFPELIGTMNRAYENVSVAQLLAHQSGLPVDAGNIPSIALVGDGAAGTVVAKRYLWARELLATRPQTAVGEYSYANAGYVVVGAMLEAVTGTSWENLMIQQIFEPLGMTHTGFGSPGTAALRDQPWGHSANSNNSLSPRAPGSAGADNPLSIGPAGTIHTSLADYALYMMAHIAGARSEPGLLTAATYQFLHAPFGGENYAMGWEVDNAPGNITILNHGGSNLRWRAQVGLIPELDIGVLTVTNAAGDKAQSAVDAMGDIIVQRVMASP
jgi:CubicO group peptidase (beta-lactamase class C family)